MVKGMEKSNERPEEKGGRRVVRRIEEKNEESNLKIKGKRDFLRKSEVRKSEEK